MSSENSERLSDWYAPSQLIHAFILHRGHENTDYLINRLLRQSIINSVADTLFMVLGFFLAR